MTEVLEQQVVGVDRFPVRQPMSKERFDPLAKEIFTLKKQLNAVILAHNYQVAEIQDVADFVGDSLGLAQQAAKTNADVIVFCGVHFMAETAKILNPGKIVVLPDKDAGCSLEESCPADKLAALQKTNPNFWTIAYINCSAAVKALCDVIVTSGNAERIVNAAPKDKDILFVPDGKDDHLLQNRSGEAICHCDRVGDHPPAAERMPGQGLHLRAGVQRDADAFGQLPLQRVQIHEDEYA